MRILYIAKHGQANSNDDEGAIAYALEQLGHEVVKVQEFGDRIPVDSPFVTDEGRLDLCLFHKWSNFEFIRRIKIPKVFWYFDLVDWPLDATLSSRCEARKRWMAEVVPLVDLGFLTDGDWQARDTTGKLHVLRQGADERVVGFGEPWKDYTPIDVLFVGGVKGCGVQRESFVKELRERYGHRFTHFSGGVYGRALANAVATSKVVVCPDSPVTDRYWSNRVYVMAGFGACLVHPGIWSAETHPVGSVSYPIGDRSELFRKIEWILKRPDFQEEVRYHCLRSTKGKHLYRHRCEELVRVVKEKLGI